jgi:bifunctional DNA-binding transcriptional regulator/antitoxin component of YhaV-PrlF toxin-antitoxin module
MATQVILTFSDGKLTIPPEVQEQMHLTEGSQLRVILTAKDRMVLEPADAATEPKDAGRSLRGILSDHPEHDTSKARAEERAWELEHDERKFGPFPKR